MIASVPSDEEVADGALAGRDEAAAGLARLRLGTDTRADARGAGTAAGGTVGSAEALAADELATVTVADVLDTGGVEGGTTVSLRPGGREGSDQEDD